MVTAQPATAVAASHLGARGFNRNHALPYHELMAKLDEREPIIATEMVSTPQLWVDFSDRLRAFIGKRIANEADAEDILQDVFLRIHQHRETVLNSNRLAAWLFQITRNAIVDFYRSPTHRREQAIGDALVPLMDQSRISPATDLDEASTLVYEELATCLLPMLDRLPSTYREAVTLAELDGLTQRQAAERLGLSLSGAKSRVQRGRRALKTMLEECCQIELDAGGRLTDYSVRDGSCDGCGGSS